eukprot:44949-Chlamydomonas_euryale.AAC.1
MRWRGGAWGWRRHPPSGRGVGLGETAQPARRDRHTFREPIDGRNCHYAAPRQAAGGWRGAHSQLQSRLTFESSCTNQVLLRHAWLPEKCSLKARPEAGRPGRLLLPGALSLPSAIPRARTLC